MSQISLKMRITTMAVLALFCTMMMASTGAMAATKAPAQATAFVQGSDALGNVLNGVFTVQTFANQSGQLVAQGVLNGTVTYANGQTTAVNNQPLTMPVSSVSASCPILNLVLGPLNLNLLGLNITLNQVVLNITAIPGAGNLLGNLLCAVAHLLDGGLTGIVDQLALLLNQILAVLATL